MTVESSPLYLFDSAGNAVLAELRDSIEDQQLSDWEDYWRPATHQNEARLKAAGIDRALWPQSRHWDWREKAQHFDIGLLTPSFCVICDGITQGMMIIHTLGSSRLRRGASTVYVEYIEVAPWNRRDVPGDQPRYGTVGSALLRAAIQTSIDVGYKGRIGLHSLPQSISWYAKLGMHDLGPDPDKKNLRYFELTPEAAAFIAKGRSP